jgi:hypothetical protein
MVAATLPSVYNYGVRIHNQETRRVVEEIIGRLPDLTGSQLGRLEDEIRRERHVGLRPPAGDGTLPVIKRSPRRPSRKFWSTVPTRTAICSWSYAATSGATARPASVDPTGTSSSTRAVSVRSSTWARPATRSVLWPPSGQKPQGSRSLLGGALHTGHEGPAWGILHLKYPRRKG